MSHRVRATESKHKQRIRAAFAHALQDKPIHVLDVPDDYGYMDAEWVELLEQAVPSVLGLEEE